MSTNIGYLIKSINDKIKIQADANLKSHNLTLTQSRVIIFLKSCNDEKATQKEIESFLGVSHPTVVGIISRMEKNNFLNCWFDVNDKRNKMVQLTHNAKAIGNEMGSVIDEVESIMLNSLSIRQVTELIEMLQIIYKNVE